MKYFVLSHEAWYHPLLVLPGSKHKIFIYAELAHAAGGAMLVAVLSVCGSWPAVGRSEKFGLILG